MINCEMILMETFDLTFKGSEIHVDGFPDAVKVIKVEGRLGARVADLALHRIDLECALDGLKKINHHTDLTVRQALWHSAITTFIKCFDESSKSRGKLDSNKVYKNKSTFALLSHKYFDHLRNKHITHDDNNYSQCQTGAILNNGTKRYKIEKIISPTFTAWTLNQGDYNNLHSLIEDALSWIDNEYNNLCNKITIELESKSYHELFQMENIEYMPPSPDSINKTRNR